jgi:hypothetical protein
MLLLSMILVLVWTTVAAAAMLRTGSVPGDALGSGGVACYVTNAGATAGTVSATLYDMSGAVLEHLPGGGSVVVPAHATVSTAFHDFTVNSPAHCECVVPSVTTFRCSVVWFDKDNPAQLFTVVGTP